MARSDEQDAAARRKWKREGPIEKLKIFLPDDIYFDCLGCGRCCHYWRLPVSDDLCEKLMRTPFYQNIKKKYPGHEIIVFDDSHSTGSLEKINGACIMMEDNQCSIHRDLGYDYKPLACRKFPLIFTSTPDGIFVSACYYCPSVRYGIGKPLDEHFASIRELITHSDVKTFSAEIVHISDSICTDWEGYLAVEKLVTNNLQRGDIMNGIWDSINPLTSLIKDAQSESRVAFSSAEIIDFLKNPSIFIPDIGFEMFNYHLKFHLQFAAKTISFLEFYDLSINEDAYNIILDGGIMRSDTYGKQMNIEPFMNYLKPGLIFWNSQEFKQYIYHLVHWRKFLLTCGNLHTSLVSLSFIPLIFNWYVHLSTNSRSASNPEASDFREAIGIIDLFFNYFQDMYFLFEKFAEGILEGY